MALSRPVWPYDYWEDEDKLNFKGCPHLQQPKDVRTIFSKSTKTRKSFFQNLESSLKMDETEFENLRDTFFKMIKDALIGLQNSYKIFEDSYLKLAGSSAEYTKIGKPDEFDFTIILPRLAHPDFFSKDKRKQNAVLLELCADLQLGRPDMLAVDIQHAIKGLMSASLIENLAPGWKFAITGCNIFERKTADTYHFTRSSDSFEVDVDICILIPFSKKTILQHPDLFKLENDQLVQSLADEEELLYVMLQRKNEVKFISSQLERNAFASFGRNSAQTQTYRLVKCIAKVSLPKIEQRYRCHRCREPIFASFYLKNIVLFLCEYYKNDEHWQEENIGSRAIEAFLILNFCFLQTVPSISGYFFPMTYNINKYLVFRSTEVTLPVTYSCCCCITAREYKTGVCNDDRPKKGYLTSESNNIHIMEESELTEIEKLCEEVVFFDLNEYLFQMQSKRKENSEDFFKRNQCLERVQFCHNHDPEEIRFDPGKSEAGMLRVFPNNDYLSRETLNDELAQHRCFLPKVEVICQLTKDVSFHKKVREYVERLETTEWNYRDVLQGVVDLLLEL